MGCAHKSVQQGKRVKILFKDSREPVIAKFEQRKAKYIHTDKGKFLGKDIRSMIIHKQTWK